MSQSHVPGSWVRPARPSKVASHALCTVLAPGIEARINRDKVLVKTISRRIATAEGASSPSSLSGSAASRGQM